jgi:hypothetical protein
MRRRGRPRLDRRRPVGQRLEVERRPMPNDALSYFWAVVEAMSLDEFDELWPDFGRRSRELAALARTKDIKTTLNRLTAAVEESPLLRQWHTEAARAVILKAISAAAVVC